MRRGYTITWIKEIQMKKTISLSEIHASGVATTTTAKKYMRFMSSNPSLN